MAAEVSQEDGFGKMNKDMLLLILERLDLRDAAVCSVLSRRWRHLPRALRRIVLDVKSFEPKDGGSERTLHDEAWSNMALAHAVESILAHRSQQHAIDHLSIKFYMSEESAGIIVRSVHDAVSSGRKIAAAEFTIRGEKFDLECEDWDKRMYAERFMSLIDKCPRAFGGLTRLYVESVRLSETDLPKVLGACEKLERLVLINCDCGFGVVLQLQHPRLVMLKIVSCAGLAVELKWLPKLKLVDCKYWNRWSSLPPLLFGHVPRLSTLEYTDMTKVAYYKALELSELVGNSPTSKLILNFQNERVWFQPGNPGKLVPLLHNLRFAGLYNIHGQCDLTWTISILESAPHLKNLLISVSDHLCGPVGKGTDFNEKNNIEWQSSDFKHYDLSVFIIRGFEANEKFIKYIKRLMEVAVNLEEICLHEDECDSCQFYPTGGYPWTDEERDSTRRQINEGRSSPIKITL